MRMRATGHRAVMVIAALALLAAPAGAADDVEAGERLYVEYECYSCHGYEGQGALMTGPAIAPDPIPLEAFMERVRRPPNVMPAYAREVISDADLRRIHAYLAAVPAPPPRDRIPALSGP